MQLPLSLTKLSLIANSITCGPKGYSLCARWYEKGQKKGSFSYFYLIVSKGVDLLFWFDPQHSRKAYLLRKRSDV
jgi:hypothetical protein